MLDKYLWKYKEFGLDGKGKINFKIDNDLINQDVKCLRSESINGFTSLNET